MKKYYLSQKLTSHEQQIYSNIMRMIDRGDTQFVFENEENETIIGLFKLILAEHPEIFWLQGSTKSHILNSGSKKTVTVYPRLHANITPSQISLMRRQFERKTAEIVSDAKRRSRDIYDQIEYIHDYIVLNTDYVSGAPNCFNAYGCLIGGKAVCSGYAAAFQVLLNALGIFCGRVEGTSSSERTGIVDHEWNFVLLGGNYYYVDVTWDDPTMHGYSSKDNLEHDYFFFNEKEMLLTHKISRDQFVPSCNSDRYNYFVYHGYQVRNYSFADVRAIAERQLKVKNGFAVKFGSQTECEKAVKDLIDNKMVYKISGVSGHITYGKSKSGLILKVENKR